LFRTFGSEGLCVTTKATGFQQQQFDVNSGSASTAVRQR